MFYPNIACFISILALYCLYEVIALEQILRDIQLRQHMLREDFEVFRFEGKNGMQIALHSHDFYECSLLISGKLSYQIESASFAEQPGDLLLIRPNLLHRPLFIHDEEPYERIVFWLSRPFVERLSAPDADLAECFAAGRVGAIRLGAAQHAQVSRLLSELIAETEEGRFARGILSRSLAAQILVFICRAARGNNAAVPREELRISSLLQRVSDYLDAHLNEEITLDALSRTVFLSKYHLERRFKQETGMSIHRMLLQKRMIRARSLMRARQPLTQIALSCGFSEYSGFYKAFRNEYGMSPREYLTYLQTGET